jgi:hypothetical protein
MPSRELTEVFLALLHFVAGLNRRHHGCRGGRCHRRPPPAPTPPLQLLSSVPPHCRVLERPPSPSSDRSAYQPMESSDPNDSPWSRRVVSCAVHGWACPNRVASAQGASSSGIQEEEGREEDVDDGRQISVVTSLVGPPAIRRTAWISIGPRGRP